MKKSSLLIICIFCFTFCSNKNEELKSFEGKIVYTSEVKQKNDKKLPRYITSFDKDVMTSTFKNGFIKNDHSNNLLYKSTIYHPKKRVIYTIDHSDSILMIPSNFKNTYQLDTTIRLDTVVEILGYTCHGIRQEFSNKESQTYFYAPELQVNPQNYKHYTMGFYYDFIKEAKSIYLMNIHEHPDYTYTIKATDINIKSIDDSEFEIKSSKIIN